MYATLGERNFGSDGAFPDPFGEEPLLTKAGLADRIEIAVADALNRTSSELARNFSGYGVNQEL